MRVACIASPDGLLRGMEKLSFSLGLPLVPAGRLPAFDVDYTLEFIAGILQLTPIDRKKGGGLFVDFSSPSAEYRRHTSGIKQDIARAVGCKPDYRPRVLDLTAGLGGDAFVLASVGCHVTLIEQNPVVYALLQDGISRALLGDNEVARIVSSGLTLLPRQDALQYLSSSPALFDVVFLDPMFPERQKSAKVKKAMQYFHDIVGFDHGQEEELFLRAREKAIRRVVVKRPKLAPDLAASEPSYRLVGKSVRYDVYVNA